MHCSHHPADARRRHAGARVGRGALRARVHDGRGSEAAVRNALSRLNARLQRWFPPHEIVDRRDADHRAHARVARGVLRRRERRRSAICRSTCAAPRSSSASGRALLAIPPGETTSYGAIAKALGSPDASRAVGAANGANPIAIIVPCHRVDRIVRLADRLRRRPRPQDVADRSRAPLARRAAGVLF